MSRKKGKVVSTIEYRKGGHHVDVDLRLIVQGGQFLYLVDHDMPQIREQHKDPNVLRDTVLKMLETLLTIEWADKICLKVESQRYNEGHRQGKHAIATTIELKLDVETWQVGTTNAGKLVHREKPWRSGNGELYEPKPDDGLPYLLNISGERQIASSAMLDDTPATRLKIIAVQEGLKRLSDQLKDLLGQDKILATLDSVRVLGLPAPAPASRGGGDA